MYVVSYIFGYGSMIILCSVEHMANNYLSKLYKIVQNSRLFMNILQKKKKLLLAISLWNLLPVSERKLSLYHFFQFVSVFTLKKIIFNLMHYLQFLGNYLLNLLAISKWKLFQCKFYTILTSAYTMLIELWTYFDNTIFCFHFVLHMMNFFNKPCFIIFILIISTVVVSFFLNICNAECHEHMNGSKIALFFSHFW